MKIYIACLAAYNSGILHGSWVNCDGLDSNDIQVEIDKVLDSSPIEDAEEYAIHDYDYEEGVNFNFGEYEDIENIVAAQELCDSIDDYCSEAIEHALEYVIEIQDAKQWLENNYFGEYESIEGFGYEYAEMCGISSDNPLYNYVDFERYGEGILQDMSYTHKQSKYGKTQEIIVFTQA